MIDENVLIVITIFFIAQVMVNVVIFMEIRLIKKKQDWTDTVLAHQQKVHERMRKGAK